MHAKLHSMQRVDALSYSFQVTGIVGRAEILAALMFLASFICYIR